MSRRGPAPGASTEGRAGFYASRGKRIFDLIFSLVVLAVSMPLLVVAAVLLWVANRGEPFFTQTRPGKNEKPFRLVKFRTMKGVRDSRNSLLPDSERLTRFGKILRRASLDELPELWNVIKGDMSLVGPRPLLMEYLKRYSPKQARRHEVKPGITGWAQVNGRNALTWEEKFALDVWYVDNRSFWLDVKILAMTSWKVIKREGISQPGQATMEEFRGGM